jgi:CRP-like cAMP-binding protein
MGLFDHFPDEPEGIFSGLNSTDLGSLEEIMIERKYDSGMKIIKAGSKGDEFYVVVRGGVNVLMPVNDEYHHLASLKPGDFFGELAAITGEKRTADVTAISNGTIVGELSMVKLYLYIVEHPVPGVTIADYLLRTISQRYVDFMGQAAMDKGLLHKLSYGRKD